MSNILRRIINVADHSAKNCYLSSVLVPRIDALFSVVAGLSAECCNLRIDQEQLLIDTKTDYRMLAVNGSSSRANVAFRTFL